LRTSASRDAKRGLRGHARLRARRERCCDERGVTSLTLHDRLTYVAEAGGASRGHESHPRVIADTASMTPPRWHRLVEWPQPGRMSPRQNGLAIASSAKACSDDHGEPRHAAARAGTLQRAGTSPRAHVSTS